ncbi:MAG: ABC transporter substrate-binding protein [Clostridiales bacterium]|nr:ABC transporter substrate-binding protein [Clostridiales bacterium]
MSNNTKQKKTTTMLLCMIAAIVIAAVFLFSCEAPQDNQNGTPSVIKVGYSKYPYPPLHYTGGNGELVGFDIELAHEAAGIMDAEIEFVPINWSENLEALESGEVDMLWGGLERASLDEGIVKFTKSYLRSDIVLLMTEDRDYTEWSDLQGLNVCALNFTPAFHYLQVYSRDVIKSKRSFTPPEYQSLMNSLSSGEFDCMIADTSFVSFFLKENSSETYKVNTVFGSNYAVGLSVANTELFEKLQAALDELEADGTIDRLKTKWIGLEVYQQTDQQENQEVDQPEAQEEDQPEDLPGEDEPGDQPEE